MVWRLVEFVGMLCSGGGLFSWLGGGRGGDEWCDFRAFGRGCMSIFCASV